MKQNDKINYIIQNGKIKKRLYEIGIYGERGPKGEKGDSLLNAICYAIFKHNFFTFDNNFSKRNNKKIWYIDKIKYLHINHINAIIIKGGNKYERFI